MFTRRYEIDFVRSSDSVTSMKTKPQGLPKPFALEVFVHDRLHL